MTDADALAALKRFSKLVRRMGETSDEGMFISENAGEPAMQPQEINVQFCVNGHFGTADELFAAIRYLRNQP